MALLTEDIPERNWARSERKILQPKLLYARFDLWILDTSLTDAGEIALHICGENRNPDAAKGFRHYLQRDRFARASCARDQAMAICHRWKKLERMVAFRNEKWLRHQ
jgi:FPC/CPF motif-containing protein YcgG